jgi:glycosyltransferase involved in cell wall biosynthesis
MQTIAPGSRPIFISEIEQFGGAERSIVALSRWLYQKRLPNHIVTYIDGCNFAQYATHPMQVVALNPGPGARKKIAAMRDYFKQQPATSPKPLLSGYQPALHATLAGMRGFHTLMHDTPSLFSDYNVRTAAGKLRIAVSNRIVAYGMRGGKTLVNSQYLRSACRHDFNTDAAIVRMAGLSPASSAPKLRTVAGRLRMFSVCRIEASKRIDWMVRSLAELERDAAPLSSRVDWQLDLAGKGAATAALTAMANDLGIGDRVHFHGFVSDDALEGLFAHAHLFLMPAIQGYGIPAIESLQRGIPVLLHRDSGVSDILLDTPWATVFTGGEDRMADAFRSAIDGVLQGKHYGVAQPRLPTEDEWAEQAATLCGWL